MIARIARGAGHALETDFPAEEKFDALAGRTRSCRARRVSDRAGRLRQVLHVLRRALYARRGIFAARGSRSSPKRGGWSKRGVREITLLGQNVNAYRGEGRDGESWSLARLIRRLREIDGLARLRYTTSHPRDMSDDLIAAHGEIDKLMPYLHLPVQSGSDRILAAMNRQHTARRLSSPRRAHSRRAARYRAVVRFHRRISRRDRRGFRSDARARARRGLCAGLLVQIQPASRNACSGVGETSSGRRESRAACATCRACCSTQQAAFNAPARSHDAGPVRKAGPQTGQAVGRSPYLQPVHVEGAAASDRRDPRRAHRRSAAQQPERRARARRIAERGSR